MLRVFARTRTYQTLTTLTALLYLYLFATLFFTPQSFLDGLGIAGTAATAFLSRRCAMLMLGFATLLLAGRKAPPSAARQAIVLAVGVCMAGFALTGIAGYLSGTAKADFLLAAAVESVLAASFFMLWFATRRQSPALPTPPESRSPSNGGRS
ncbi:MAG TPA: hypothetical protein PKK12_02690 [Candidatus Aminicenantes bacterium]|nr:hypothetical protein [Candidatus Aminicenantes bacterium]